MDQQRTEAETTTKHRPATPLPWAITNSIRNGDVAIVAPGTKADDGRPVILAEVFEDIIQMDECNRAAAKQNAAYIARAANAYPKLVEALRAFAQSGERQVGQHRGAAFALLRELGESS